MNFPPTLSCFALICEIRRRVARLAQESVAANSLRATSPESGLGAQGRGGRGAERAIEGEGAGLRPDNFRRRGGPGPGHSPRATARRAAARPAPRKHPHVRPAPPPRARAPGSGGHGRARGARCPHAAPALGSRRLRLPAPLPAGPRTRRRRPWPVGSRGRGGAWSVGAREGAPRGPPGPREAMSPGAGPCVRRAPRQAGR